MLHEVHCRVTPSIKCGLLIHVGCGKKVKFFNFTHNEVSFCRVVARHSAPTHLFVQCNLELSPHCNYFCFVSDQMALINNFDVANNNHDKKQYTISLPILLNSTLSEISVLHPRTVACPLKAADT